MGTVKSYEDLEIWKSGIELVTKVYSVTKKLPADERWGLITQLNRASVSVPTNIAEGWGRGRSASQCQFLRIARGSLYEVRTLLVICGNEYPQLAKEAHACKQNAESLSMKLNACLTVVSDSVHEIIAQYGLDRDSDIPNTEKCGVQSCQPTTNNQ